MGSEGRIIQLSVSMCIISIWRPLFRLAAACASSSLFVSRIGLKNQITLAEKGAPTVACAPAIDGQPASSDSQLTLGAARASDRRPTADCRLPPSISLYFISISSADSCHNSSNCRQYKCFLVALAWTPHSSCSWRGRAELCRRPNGRHLVPARNRGPLSAAFPEIRNYKFHRHHLRFCASMIAPA